MKNILCFGDSNTYGHKPDKSGRYDFSIRYPGRLQTLLGDSFHIVEEGCPGRTTVFEDKNRLYMRGIDYIVPCLRSHKPLDLVIVMLGTNDCKHEYNATEKEITDGLEKVIKAIQNTLSPTPKILIVSPIHLGENVWDFDPEFGEGSLSVSKRLAAEYKALSERLDCLFFDASKVTQASVCDRVHLDEAGHRALSDNIAEIIREFFAC